MASINTKSKTSWAGDPRPFVGPKNGKPGEILELDVTRVHGIGWEDTTKTFDAATNSQKVVYSGHQVVTVSFRLESFSVDFPPYDTLANLLLKFRRQSTLDALAELGVAYAGKHDIVPMELNADNRPIYCAVCECDFNFLAVETDETATGGIIQTINGFPAPAVPRLPGGTFPV